MARESVHRPGTSRSRREPRRCSSFRFAKRNGLATTIGTEHILLGLVREGEGVGAQVLVNLGADLKGIRQAVVGLLGAHPGELTRPRPGRRAGREQPDEIVDRLDSIAARLAAIEGRLGIEQEPLPAMSSANTTSRLPWCARTKRPRSRITTSRRSVPCATWKGVAWAESGQEGGTKSACHPARAPPPRLSRQSRRWTGCAGRSARLQALLRQHGVDPAKSKLLDEPGRPLVPEGEDPGRML